MMVEKVTRSIIDFSNLFVQNYYIQKRQGAIGNMDPYNIINKKNIYINIIKKLNLNTFSNVGACSGGGQRG